MLVMWKILREVRAMALDVSKLQHSVTRLEGDVDRLLTVLDETKAKVEDLAAQLAAAQDPAAVAAVQKELDDLAVSLDAESDKVETAAPEPPAPTA